MMSAGKRAVSDWSKKKKQQRQQMEFSYLTFGNVFDVALVTKAPVMLSVTETGKEG